MTTINNNAILIEMQKLINESQKMGLNEEPQSNAPFSHHLSDALQKVNATQEDANQLMTRFELGDPDVTLSEVMISMQKSNVSLQAVTQVRNKLINAYQEIMNMPI